MAFSIASRRRIQRLPPKREREEAEKSDGVVPVLQGGPLWNPNSVWEPNDPRWAEKTKHQLADVFRPSEDEHSAWNKPVNKDVAHSIDVIHSVGDGIVTASITALGQIVHFGRYLGAGTSGMFSADHTSAPEPFLLADRAQHLLDLGRGYDDHFHTYGLLHPMPLSSAPPKISYVHYRWPRFEYKNKDLNVAIQWMAHSGTVLQQVVIENDGPKDDLVQFRFLAGIHIRDLDYATEDKNNSGALASSLGPNGYSWVLVQKQPAQAEGEQPSDEKLKNYTDADAVGVVVSVFLDGTALKWNGKDCPWERTVLGKESGKEPASRRMEVTVAYRMLYLPQSRLPWEEFVIPAATADVNKFLRTEPFASISLSTIDIETNAADLKMSVHRNPTWNSNSSPTEQVADHIEFTMRRHLERILSVCAISTRPPSLTTAEPDGVDPVALTCGDISDHCIVSSASFFAFNFLTNTYLRLKHLNCNGDTAVYVNRLLERISNVCDGHMKWLSQLDKTNGIYGASYWATGKLASPDSRLTDTPYQLIKACEYLRLFPPDEQPYFNLDALRNVAGQWMRWLKELDNRGKLAWPHMPDDGFRKFRLDDHVWIWRALKAVDDLGTWKDTDAADVPDGEDRDEMTDAELSRHFRPGQVKLTILRRFTTVNDVSSSKRMLAVTRSPRFTRFLFHARDTALIYAMDSGFFEKDTPYDEGWTGTLDCQRRHDSNQEADWDNAIRYALAIAMGTRGFRMNKDKPEDLVRISVIRLMEIASTGGFFSGQLNETTKEPMMFWEDQDRDFYFHASFEIPYMLLTHAQSIQTIYEAHPAPKSPKPKPAINVAATAETENDVMTVLRTVIEQLTTQDKHQYTANSGAGRYHHDHDENQLLPPNSTNRKVNSSRLAHVGRNPVTMKKTMPFNSRIDYTHVVDIEEEWLYDYPSFLLKREARITPDPIDRDTGLDPWYAKQDAAYVIDIPQRKSLSSKTARRDDDLPQKLCKLQDLKTLLNGPRVAKDAKKRLVWMYCNESLMEQVAQVHYDTARDDDEQAAMQQFFKRHSEYDTYFFDDTTMVLNTWDTELHVSFYRVVANKDAAVRDMDAIAVPGGKTLTRASMGFRFVGDIFDRNWTCHFVEHEPRLVADKTASSSSGTSDLWDLPFKASHKDRRWSQRKVLELHLYERILNKLMTSTEEALDAVQAGLNAATGSPGEDWQSSTAMSFMVGSSDDYFSSTEQWQRCQDILHMIDEALDGVLMDVAARWATRETDRGQEQPRWTRNDERKYRGIITKLQASTDGKRRALQMLRRRVQMTRERLARRQDQVRDDLGLRGAENIRFFTYVTVVFLPLGFAVSIFSMGDSNPVASVLGSMIVCAVIALGLTVIALVKAKTLANHATAASRAIGGYTSKTMEASALLGPPTATDWDNGRRPSAKRAALDDVENDLGGRIQSGQSGVLSKTPTKTQSSHGPATDNSHAWHLWFWCRYVLVELPARRVLRAVQVLREDMRGNIYVWIGKCITMVAGLLFMPLFLVSWVLQIALYNTGDFVRIVWHWIASLVEKAKAKEDDKFRDHIRLLTYPPDGLRPMKAAAEGGRTKCGRNTTNEQAVDELTKDSTFMSDG